MPVRRAWPPAVLLLLAGTLACGREDEEQLAYVVAGGEAARGPAAMERYGCGACHIIPGVRRSDGLVGPPLTEFAHRAYVGGLLPNRPDHLVAWIRDPKRFDPRTAMPVLGVSEEEARDMAAYLYTLR